MKPSILVADLLASFAAKLKSPEKAAKPIQDSFAKNRP
jgi:hypothetical protein